MVCGESARLRVELVDVMHRVVIRSSQAVSEPTDTALGDDVEDVRLAGPAAEIPVRQ